MGHLGRFSVIYAYEDEQGNIMQDMKKEAGYAKEVSQPSQLLFAVAIP
jgi:hypothetical protein